MKNIYYLDNSGEKHFFSMKAETISSILLEFGTIKAYLKSMGIHFSDCGVA